MRDRVRRIWFPGLLALLLAYGGQTIIFRIESPKVLHLDSMFLVISYPWLGLLLACGLLASWLCYHEGGSPRERLLVSQFPVLLMLGTFLLALAASLAFETYIPLRLKLLAFFGYLTWSVVLPSTALLAGATPMIAHEQFGQEAETEVEA